MMCYMCGPALLVEQPGFTIVYTRVADPYTQVTDFEYLSDQIAAYEAGEWVYVGLTATLMVKNNPVVTRTVFGVRETPEQPCAFSNELASAWVTGEVLEEYATRGDSATTFA